MRFQRRAFSSRESWLAPGGSTTACDCPRFVYSGFSVIELLVVVSIIVVLSAIAIPSIITVSQNYRIAGDTREIPHGCKLSLRAHARGLPGNQNPA